MYEDLITFTVYIFLFLVTSLVIKYNWDRRWLYYHASKFKGHESARAWPFFGHAIHFLGTLEVASSKWMKHVENVPPVFKIWVGPLLFILNTQPEEVEIIINKYFEKPELMNLIGDVLGFGIVISPYAKWKKNRKIINVSFSFQIVKSFFDSFVKHSNRLVDDLKEEPQDRLVDMYQKIWGCSLDITCETLFDIDVNLFNNYKKYKHEYMSNVTRGLDITLLRFFQKPWLLLDIFWKLSPHYKEFQLCVSKIQAFRDKIYEIKKSQQTDGVDITKEKQFLNNLLNNGTKITEEEVLEEISNMLFGSTETSATTTGFVLLILAILQDVQIKVYEELCSIFEESKRDVTFEDLKKMEYLERVIKETMRLFPIALVFARVVPEDFELNNYVYPKGCNIAISPYVMSRSSKLWKDPLVFNPDRFLPEEVKKMHRCSFIPFSYGARNCPGNLFGMLSMKIMLSTLLRNYKITSCNYQSLEDIKMVFNITTKANKGFKVTLARRN